MSDERDRQHEIDAVEAEVSRLVRQLGMILGLLMLLAVLALAVLLERVDIQAFDGLANLIQAPFGCGGLGERSSSDVERSPVGSDGTAFAGQTHGSRPNGGR
jgi:hypothetical protein